MVKSIDCAMVFAAGLGKRMRPLTDSIPKPLIEVGGKTMLDRALDRLEGAGVKKAIVNSHYKSDILHEHLERSQYAAMHVVVSHEPVLLETGGGIVKALPELGENPFFSLNSDIVWLDGATPALQRLRGAWDPDIMDALLLIHPVDKAIGYDERGDFEIKDDGQLYRTMASDFSYVFTGIQIIKPELFAGYKEEPFSLTEIYKKMVQQDGSFKRMYGVVHDGDWLHIGTPEGVDEANTYLAQKAA